MTIADQLRKIETDPNTQLVLMGVALKLDAFAARLLVADPDTAEHVTLAIGNPENVSGEHYHSVDCVNDEGDIVCRDPAFCPFLTQAECSSLRDVPVPAYTVDAHGHSHRVATRAHAERLLTRWKSVGTIRMYNPMTKTCANPKCQKAIEETE